MHASSQFLCSWPGGLWERRPHTESGWSLHAIKKTATLCHSACQSTASSGLSKWLHRPFPGGCLKRLCLYLRVYSIYTKDELNPGQWLSPTYSKPTNNLWETCLLPSTTEWAHSILVAACRSLRWQQVFWGESTWEKPLAQPPTYRYPTPPPVVLRTLREKYN